MSFKLLGVPRGNVNKFYCEVTGTNNIFIMYIKLQNALLLTRQSPIKEGFLQSKNSDETVIQLNITFN